MQEDVHNGILQFGNQGLYISDMGIATVSW